MLSKAQSWRIFLYFFFSALIASSHCYTAYAEASPPDLETWPDAMISNVKHRIDELGDGIPDAIFDAIEDISIFRHNEDEYSVDLSIHRRVFDNRDIINSWTVMDRFEVEGIIPLYTAALGSVGFAGATGQVGFYIGSKFGIDFINIRQVSPHNYANLPSAEERRREIEGTSWYQDFIAHRSNEKNETQGAKGEWVVIHGDDGKKKLSFLPLSSDPENDARYSKFWNLILLPFSLPLKAGSVLMMENGEIISYVGSGAIEAGPSVGWDLDPSGVSGVVNAGISYSTFVKGMFRISVLRESERFVKVKVTRALGFGHGASGGAHYKPSALDGIIIIRDLQRNLKVNPFNIQAGQSWETAFDVGYRYDLTNADARQAYEDAVLGRLVLSDQLAIDPLGHPRDPAITGVQKVFTRDSNTRSTGITNKMRLGFIFKREHVGTLSQVDAVVTLPDGVHHIFSSIADNSKSWRLFWGSFEKFQHRFMVNLDLDKYQSDPSSLDSFTLIAEGKMDDSNANRDAMLDYILEVEDSVGKVGIFPRPPSKPIEQFPGQNFLFPEHFGRSSFYYRVGINNEQIQKFINTPQEKMWPALEKIFQVQEGSWSNFLARVWYYFSRSPLISMSIPLYIADINLRPGTDLWHANIIHDQWEKIKETPNPKARAETLGALFFDRIYSYELAHLVRTILDGEKVAYLVTGYNPTFGRIFEEGDTTLNPENLATRLEREIDFDHGAPHPPDGSSKAVLTDFVISVVEHGFLEIKFHLEQNPSAMFFQLKLNNWWWPFNNKIVSSFLVENRGQFQAGENKIVVDFTDSKSSWYDFVKVIENGNNYLIRAAVNNDRLHWGPVAEAKFNFQNNTF